MSSYFIKLAGASLLAGIVVACGGGGGGIAGIGGSGFISTGTVTGFGSVFVNGIEFDTRSTIYEIEDTSGSQQDLRIGMVVQVEGSINADGTSGTATGIRYGDQLEGPVTGTLNSPNAIEVNPDGNQKTFRVLGTNVIIDNVNTVFSGSGFGFDSIALNNVVEISGHYDHNNVLRASYVELKALTFSTTVSVEIEGEISGLAGTSFTLRNVNVNAASSNLSDLPNGLQNGIYVEVKGNYNISSNTITANQVEAEDIGIKDDGSNISIEGYITRFVSNSDFDIDGQKVNAGSASFEPINLQLRTGIKVEAHGPISNGILNASEVEIRGGDAEIHAIVTNLNVTANTFDLEVVTGHRVTVTLNAATTLEDDVLGIEPFRLNNLNNGDFVEVIGFETGISAITATKIKRKNASDVILQGYATTASGDSTAGGTITVLGVPYNFDSGTSFENTNDFPLNSSQIDALITSINSTPSLVKIKDEFGLTPGTAEEIDQED